MPATSKMGRAPQPTGRVEKAERPLRLRRDGPIPIADAYLLKGVFGASLRGLAWFAGLFLAFAIVTSARRLAQESMPASLVLQGIAMQVPRIVLFTIPASLLFGTMSTFTEMSSRGEITALMAGGMSLWRMLRSLLVFAALMGAFAFILQEVVVPGAESRKDDIVKSAATNIGVQEGFKIVDARSNGTIKRIVQAESFDPAALSLAKPVVQFFRDDNTIEREVQAETARWDKPSKSWILENGEMSTKPKKTGGASPFEVQTQFHTWTLETDASLLPSSLGSGKVTTADRLAKHNYEMVSISDLNAYRQKLLGNYATEQGAIRHSTGKEIRAITFGIHDKFATPLVCIAMILIGAPLGIRPQRTASSGLAMGLSLVVLIFYYIIWTLATSWGKGGGQAPQIVAYMSFAITAAIGVVLVWRKS